MADLTLRGRIHLARIRVRNWLESLAARAWGALLYRRLKYASPFFDDKNERLRVMIAGEIRAIGETIEVFGDYQMTETNVIAQRLGRRYDPGMALNEAAERVRKLKGDALTHELTGEKIELTGKQLAALEFQKRYLAKIGGHK